ncbi:coiled-coil domain-containing protein 12-like [Watersipora subatra]|uniref:coiled-coil domain-containing protein 12-like n=1 Tax=Watersipora subatra TaxID=2589382 RepID=UPI00355C1329
MSTVGSLEIEAKKRKQRLLALRAKKEGKTVEELTENEKNDPSLPKPIFRSYKPTDENLKENAIENPQPIEVSEKVKDQLASGKPEPILDEVDLASLAPRKPDWDLRRDVSKKLEKLERRTQRAIAELIRERLQGDESKDGDLLARAVNAAGKQKSDED